MAKIDPNFKDEIKKYGAFDLSACYNCGNCTAVCSLSTEDNSFPRKMVRYSMLGLKDDLDASLDPWLCYYCGECSATCPREADPGELMMSLRRYLITRYDWTGLSKKLYTSKIWEIVSISVISLIVLLLFVIFHGPMTTELTAQGGVQLNVFADVHWVELGDLIMAGILSFFLITNIIYMYFKIFRGSEKIKVPLKNYFIELWRLFFHFATQWSFKKSERTTKIGKKELKGLL